MTLSQAWFVALIAIVIIGGSVMGRDVKHLNAINPPNEEEKRRSDARSNAAYGCIAIVIVAIVALIYSGSHSGAGR